MELRARYLDAARLVVDLVALPEVVAAWDQASVLPKMTVGELAAHVARSVLQVETFLDEPDPQWAEPISAGSYFAVLRQTADIDSSLNQGVRQRAVEVAVHGPDGVHELVSTCLNRLTPRLPNESTERQVMAYGGRALTLDEYLRTRFVEICVHHADLLLSVPAAATLAHPSPDAVAIAVDVMVAAARERHGDHAVLLALTRRERDALDVLRVL
jgi:Mycothiol maleylpyruvate isomerase N-terminal domain